MQRGHGLVDVEVHDHGGVLPVRAARGLGVPAGLHQAHERIHGVRERRGLRGRVLGAVTVAVVGACAVAVVRQLSAWSRFQAAISPSRWDCRAASNFAASRRGSVIR